ncbi:MAG: helix-turn-helix domain-containing protein [Roseburia sp.]|nr:helix-turn-helix domain-containing protein [Roseburia sp.]
MDYDFFNNKIEELRRERHLTQKELAQLVGTSQGNISRWEMGMTEPNVIECWKLADFFGVSIDFLCGRKEY